MKRWAVAGVAALGIALLGFGVSWLAERGALR